MQQQSIIYQSKDPGQNVYLDIVMGAIKLYDNFPKRIRKDNIHQDIKILRDRAILAIQLNEHIQGL